jgi:hypothetical protein
MPVPQLPVRGLIRYLHAEISTYISADFRRVFVIACPQIQAGGLAQPPEQPTVWLHDGARR